MKTSLTLQQAIKRAHEIDIKGKGNHPLFFDSCKKLQELYEASPEEMDTALKEALGNVASSKMLEVIKKNI